MQSKAILGQEDVTRILAAARAEAQKNNWAVGIAVVCAGIVAAVLISRQLQNTQAQTRKQKDEKSAYHRKKGGK